MCIHCTAPAPGSSSMFPQRGAETEMFWLPVHGKDGVLHTWRRAKSHSPAPAADPTNPQEKEETEILAVHAGNRICLEFRVHEFGPFISKYVKIISYTSGEQCRYIHITHHGRQSYCCLHQSSSLSAAALLSLSPYHNFILLTNSILTKQ